MEKNMDEKMDDRSGHGSGVTGKSGLPHMTMIVILGMAGFVSAADNWVISALLPAVAADFGTGIVTAAGMLTAYLVPYGIMQPVYGYLADRWGKARILKGVLSGLTAATAGCVLAPALVWLMICRFVAGFFAAGIIAVSLAMIGDETEPEKRPQSVGLFMGMVFLGQGVSAGFGGFFAGWLDWRMTFVCLIAIALVTLWLYRRLPEGRVAPSQNAFLSETIRIVLSEKGRIIFPMAFAAGFLMLGAYSYLGACLHEVAGATYSLVGLVVMGFGLASFATGSRLGWLSKRFAPRVLLASGGLLGVSAVVLLALFPLVTTEMVAALMLWAGYIFMQSTLATQAFSVADESKGLPSALVGLGLFGGGGAGTAAGGWCLGLGGYTLLWITSAGLLSLFVLVSLSSPVRRLGE